MSNSRPEGTVGGRYIGKKSVCHNAGIWARPAAIREEGRKGVFGVYIPICAECHKPCRTYETNPRPAYEKKRYSFISYIKKILRKVKK